MSEKTEICPDCEGSGRIHIAGGSAGCINCGRSGYIRRPIAEPTDKDSLTVETGKKGATDHIRDVTEEVPSKLGENGGEVGTPRVEVVSIESLEKERDEWRDTSKNLYEVLKEAQWGNFNNECPACGSHPRHGHSPKCWLKEALAAYELKAKDGV